jgi:hypothetical protein
MARPPLSEDEKPIIIMVKLRLYPGRHDRLIAFFKGIPDRLRSASVIQVMSGGSLDAIKIDDLPSDDDIEAAFDALMSV